MLFVSTVVCCALNSLHCDLSESGHGFTGDELSMIQSGDETKGLILCLTPLWFPEDQCTKDLHMLFERKTNNMSLETQA